MNIFEKIHGTAGLLSIVLAIATLFAEASQWQYATIVATAFFGGFSIFVVMTVIGFLSLIWSE